jgi:hypothetical protein
MKAERLSGVRRVELGSRQAMAVEARPGTIVRCLEGTIWLTQEGLFSDTILIPGTRFVADTHGKIVLNALDGSGTAQVYVPGCGATAHAGSGLQVDAGVIERVERAARRARAREIARLARKLGTYAAAAWHSLTRRDRQIAV